MSPPSPPAPTRAPPISPPSLSTTALEGDSPLRLVVLLGVLLLCCCCCVVRRSLALATRGPAAPTLTRGVASREARVGSPHDPPTSSRSSALAETYTTYALSHTCPALAQAAAVTTCRRRLWKAHKQWEAAWCDISLGQMGGQGAGDEERRLGRGSGAEGRCAHGDGSLAEGAPTPRGAETATRSSAAGRWRPARGLHSSPSLPLALHSPHLPLPLREGASQKRMELRRKEKVAAVPGSWRDDQSPCLPPTLSTNAPSAACDGIGGDSGVGGGDGSVGGGVGGSGCALVDEGRPSPSPSSSPAEVARPHSTSRGHTSTRRQFSQRVPIQPTGQVSTASETTRPDAEAAVAMGGGSESAGLGS